MTNSNYTYLTVNVSVNGFSSQTTSLLAIINDFNHTMKYYDVHHFADIQISCVSKSIKHLNKDINGLDI